jgi:HAD superfamily hydrolase (TIGR01662 family)
MKKIVLIVGFPGAGKSTIVEDLLTKGYKNFNRDKSNVSLEQFNKDLEYQLKHGNFEKVVIDNTYGTIDQRKPVIDLAKKYGYEIEAWVMSTTLEEAQVNAVQRQIHKYGSIMTPEMKKTNADVAKDPNMFPPAAQYAYKKHYQKPTTFEGFDKVETIKFVRRPYGPEYVNKAVIFDYDGTLRKTKSGAKYPVDPQDIEILKGRKEKLDFLKAQGYLLLGVSNQSGIAKGYLDMSKARKCFKHTNDLLGHDIDVEFCSHTVPPIVCFCRKPSPGLGVHFIEKYKLDPNETIMIGDMTTDKTFAARCGFKYIDAHKFFN